MAAAEYPVELRGTYSPTRLQRGYAKAQQTFLGLNHQQETQASTGFKHLCSPGTAFCSLKTDNRKGSPSDSKSSYTTSSTSEDSNGNNELHTITHSSGKRHTITHYLGHSGGTSSTPHRQQVSFPDISLDRESQICAQIEDYIAKQLKYFRTILTLNFHNGEHSNKEWDEDPTPQSDGITPDVHSVAHLPTTPAADKDVESQTLNCAVIEQRTVAVRQVVEEDSPNGVNANTDFIITSKEKGGCAMSATEKHSTEYPKVLRTAAATSTKNEDEGPVVLTAVPGRTREEHAKKQTSLMLNRHSSQENKSRGINKKKLRVLETPGIWSGSSKDMTKRKKRVAALKVEAKGLDHVPCATEVLKGFQNKSSSPVSENKTFELEPLNQVANEKEIKTLEDQQHQGLTCQKTMSHSKPNVLVDKLLNNNVSIPTNQSIWQCSQTNTEGVVEDAGAVHEETDFSMALSENKGEKHTSISESEGEEALNQPVYENITDDDLPQPAEHGESSFTARYEAPQYEDISENESPNTEVISEEVSSPTQVPEPRDKQSLDGNEGYGHVQGLGRMETEMSSDEELIPKDEDSPKTDIIVKAQRGSIETDDGFEGLIYPKCDSERLTNHPDPCSPFSVLNDEDETDDETNDDYLVIPISVSALKFEPENEDQDRPEKFVSHSPPRPSVSPPCSTSPKPWPPKKQVTSSAFPSLEVFETRDSFLQAKALQFQIKTVDLDWNTPDVKMEPHRPQSSRESEDSCDTDDSCDYPSKTEENNLLVPRLCKKRSAPDDIIIIDSDTEDETDNFGNTSPGKQPNSLDKEADSSLCPNHGVARLVVVKPCSPNKSLKLLKEHEVHRQSTDGALPAKTFTASSQKTDSCVKDKPHLNRNKKGQFEEIPKNDEHHAVRVNNQASITEPRMESRRVSLPRQEGPSTTFSSSSPTIEQLSEARKSSDSSQDLSPPSKSTNSASPPTSKQSTSMPRHLSSSKLQWSHAHSAFSTFSQSYSPTEDHSGSASMELSARERLNRDCANNYIPMRRTKKRSLGMEEDLRTNDFLREPRPGPSQHDKAPRQRHSSQKPETPLMKKTKTDAVQWTKAINKDLQGERRSSVGEGYKWSEKPSKATHFHKHGSSRERRKYRYSQ